MAGVALERKRFGDAYRSLAHETLENRRNEVANRANEESVPATCVRVAYSPAYAFIDCCVATMQAESPKWINGDRNLSR